MGTRPGGRPGHEEKLAVIKLNTHYYPGSNLSKACELFVRLDRAQKKEGNEALVKLKDFKGLDRL